MTTQTNAQLKAKLQNLLCKEEVSIRQEVIKESLSPKHCDSIECFFDHMISQGSQNGLAGCILSDAQKDAFFERHYDEIEEIRLDNLELYVQILLKRDDLILMTVMFAFDQVILQVAEELGIS